MASSNWHFVIVPSKDRRGWWQCQLRRKDCIAWTSKAVPSRHEAAREANYELEDLKQAYVAI